MKFYSGELTEQEKKQYFIEYGRDGYRWRRALKRWNHYSNFIIFPTIVICFIFPFTSLVPKIVAAAFFGAAWLSEIPWNLLHFLEGRAVEKELYRRKGIKVKIWVLRLGINDKVYSRNTYLLLCKESGMPVDPYLDDEENAPS